MKLCTWNSGLDIFGSKIKFKKYVLCSEFIFKDIILLTLFKLNIRIEKLGLNLFSLIKVIISIGKIMYIDIFQHSISQKFYQIEP